MRRHSLKSRCRDLDPKEDTLGLEARSKTAQELKSSLWGFLSEKKGPWQEGPGEEQHLGRPWDTPQNTPLFLSVHQPTPQAPRRRCLVRRGTCEAQPRGRTAPPPTHPPWLWSSLGFRGQSAQTLTFIPGPSKSPPGTPPRDVVKQQVRRTNLRRWGGGGGALPAA